MYKRRSNQISVFEDPTMFGGIPLNPENEWVKLAKLIPRWAFEEKYSEQFPSNTGQPADSLRVALGSQIIKEKYKFSDEMTVEHITMNPYLQYFIGLTEFTQAEPFHPSMMTRFRNRHGPEIIQEVNDVIIGRKTVKEVIAKKDDSDSRDDHNDGSCGADEERRQGEEANSGTLILDATCAPQAIRFPTDTSLLDEARKNAERIIDSFHKAGLTDGRKPRTYRVKAKKLFNGFSRARKKTYRSIRTCKRQQLNFLRRDLRYIDEIYRSIPRHGKRH